MITTYGSVELASDSVLDVIVIGAGQSGLAIGRQLQQRGRSFLIVDAGPETGYVWRSRWDSLTLFTAARYSGLPGLPFPGDPDSYPTKDAVAQYLQRYATTFGLSIRHRTRVTRGDPGRCRGLRRTGVCGTPAGVPAAASRRRPAAAF